MFKSWRKWSLYKSYRSLPWIHRWRSYPIFVHSLVNQKQLHAHLANVFQDQMDYQTATKNNIWFCVGGKPTNLVLQLTKDTVWLGRRLRWLWIGKRRRQSSKLGAKTSFRRMYERMCRCGGGLSLGNLLATIKETLLANFLEKRRLQLLSPQEALPRRLII